MDPNIDTLIMLMNLAATAYNRLSVKLSTSLNLCKDMLAFEIHTVLDTIDLDYSTQADPLLVPDWKSDRNFDHRSRNWGKVAPREKYGIT